MVYHWGNRYNRSYADCDCRFGYLEEKMAMALGLAYFDRSQENRDYVPGNFCSYVFPGRARRDHDLGSASTGFRKLSWLPFGRSLPTGVYRPWRYYGVFCDYGIL